LESTNENASSDRQGTVEQERHVADALSEYLNGELPEPRLAAIRAHLASCPVCRHDLTTLQLTVRALNELPLQTAPRSFALPESAAPSRRLAFLSTLFWTRTAVGVLAAMLVVVLALRFGTSLRSGGAPSPEIASAPAAAPLGAYRPEPPGAVVPAARGQGSAVAQVAQPARQVGPGAARPLATPVPAAAYPGATSAYPGPLTTPAPPSNNPAAYPYPQPSGGAQTAPIAQRAPLSRAPVASTPATSAAPEPLLQPSSGPIWYTPALGLLAVLAVVAAAAMLILDRRKR